MKRSLPFILLTGGIILFIIAFVFYQKSERIKSETDTLRSITTPQASSLENETVYEPEPEPVFDSTDLDQTPPGVEPFYGTSICMVHWGQQLREYCAGGDEAVLDMVEGDNQAEVKRVFNMCLDELLELTDVYGTGERAMDSKMPLTETSRIAFACEITARYGDSPVFEDSSIHYIVKNHMESGNISRLENR